MLDFKVSLLGLCSYYYFNVIYFVHVYLYFKTKHPN